MGNAMALDESRIRYLDQLNGHGLKLSEDTLSRLLDRNMARFQESFLIKIISNAHDDAQDLLNQANALKMNFSEPYFTVCTLEVQVPVSDIAHDAVFLLLYDSLKETMNASGIQSYFCIDAVARLCCIINMKEPGSGSSVERALSAAVQQLKNVTDIQVFCGIGSAVDSICRLSESRDDAVAALERERDLAALPEAALYDIDERYCSRETIQAHLLQCFRESDLPGIQNAIEQHISFLKVNARGKQPLAERFLFAYLQSITNESMRLGVTLERFESYVPAVVNLMQSDVTGSAEAMIHLTEQILKYISVHRTSESNHLLNMAKDYIRDHLGDERLDLEAVSNHVGLSRVYFCKLFHQMEGVSFNAYLKKARIEKAKQLLLTTNMKVYEISNVVGFSHSKYFGHVFKQTVGQTPVEFQKSIHE